MALSICFNCNERYAIGLAATLRSAAENCSAGEISVYVLDDGIAPDTKAKVAASMKGVGARVDIQWVAIPPSILNQIPNHPTWPKAAYLRLFLTELLPPQLGRIIYLDCDMIVLKDLMELWTVELGGHLVAAVQDLSLPTVSTPTCLANFAELGLAADTKYFNSGLLVVNGHRWREESMPARLMDYLRKHPEQVEHADQNILNAVVRGRWLPLHPRWNQLPGCVTSKASETVLAEDVFNEAARSPAILHFTKLGKPWNLNCSDPRRETFFNYLDRTRWRGWRPTARTPMGRILRFAQTHRHQLLRATLRKLSALARRRAG